MLNTISIAEQLWFLLRIVVAGLCGVAIGFERKNRSKEAGVRTHFIVACAAALMMVVSKYGFMDLVNYHDAIKVDPSRVAAQIVSGIGFIGAGIIFIQKRTVTGLTTAAGIWATAGIGMAIGGGLYVVGIVATGLILLGQLILHKNIKLVELPHMVQLSLKGQSNRQIQQEIDSLLLQHKIVISDVRTCKQDDGSYDLDYILELPLGFNDQTLLDLIPGKAVVKLATTSKLH